MSTQYKFAADGQLIHDWAIRKGATNTRTYVWSAGQPDPVPVDLSGYTARMQIRETYDAASAVLSITDVLSADGIVTLGVDGSIEIKLDPDSTAALTITKGVYDLELVSAGGDVKNFVGGKVSILPEATR